MDFWNYNFEFLSGLEVFNFNEGNFLFASGCFAGSCNKQDFMMIVVENLCNGGFFRCIESKSQKKVSSTKG